MTQPILKTMPLLTGLSNVDTTGQFFEVSNCLRLSVTTVVTVSANTLVASFALGGTNDDPFVSTFPALTNGVLITAAPTGWTLTAAGLLTAGAPSPAIGTYEITVDYTRFPKWIRAIYDYTSGGGIVDARVIAVAWS